MASEAAPMVITVGTRRSPLALKQVDLVVELLQRSHPHVTFEVRPIMSAGDTDKTTPLPSMGKGVWTNELEAELAAGTVDLVVHSLKDMPTSLPEGFVLAAITDREDPRDVVVIRNDAAHASYKVVADLPDGSLVGTSSLRRSAQLKRKYPGLRFRDYRGNIDTRLKKLDVEGGEFDAIIVAAAGMLRMNFGGRISQYLDSKTGGILHAVGQGAIGIECREGDSRVLEVVKAAAHEATMAACWAERTVMRTLEGGCSVPIGVETEWEDGGKKLRLRATVVSLDGTEAVDSEMVEQVATLDEADALGKKVAQDLVDKGAAKILEVVTATRLAPPQILKTVEAAASA